MYHPVPSAGTAFPVLDGETEPGSQGDSHTRLWEQVTDSEELCPLGSTLA